MKLNDPRRIPIVFRIDVRGTTPDIRRAYRQLRHAGMSRHNTNFFIAGVAAAHGCDVRVGAP